MTQPDTDTEVLERILHFPDGLPGFPDLERFVLVDLREDAPSRSCAASTIPTSRWS